MTDVKKLKVMYNDVAVGYLSADDDGTILFQYDDEWVRKGFSVSPLSLPLVKGIQKARKSYFSGLPAVFADSLPDGWSELLVRRKMPSSGIDYDSLSSLTKLALTSDLSLGALSYFPSLNGDDVDKDGIFDLDEYSKQANVLLDQGQIIDKDFLYGRGGSSGGTRPKAYFKDGNEWWIVKFPCRYDPIGISEKEYLANECAAKCGIHVNEYKLIKGTKGSYFAVKRFDRKNGRRVHMVSASALLETRKDMPVLDYSHLFRLVQRISCQSEKDMKELCRRMCFNVFFENKDDHGGNFSFLYDEEKNGYCLSPFYDITSTRDKSEHETTVLNEGNPSDKELKEIADQFHIQDYEIILETVKKTCQEYRYVFD